MPVIKAQKIPKPTYTASDLILKFCYYYPQYKISDARKLSTKTIIKALSVVKREQLLSFSLLTAIINAAQNEQSAKSMIQSLEEEINNG